MHFGVCSGKQDLFSRLWVESTLRGLGGGLGFWVQIPHPGALGLTEV